MFQSIFNILLIYNLSACATEIKPPLPLVPHKETKRITYLFGPDVVYAEKEVMQAFCYTPNQLHDDGSKVNSDKEIAACYDPVTRSVWLDYDHPEHLRHELCHDDCFRSEIDQKILNLCNAKCERY